MSQSKLTKIANNSFKQAAREIIKPTIDAGGCGDSVTVVLERTIIAVLLFVAKKDSKKAAFILENGLVPRILEQLSDFENGTNRKDGK